MRRHDTTKLSGHRRSTPWPAIASACVCFGFLILLIHGIRSPDYIEYRTLFKSLLRGLALPNILIFLLIFSTTENGY